MTRFIAQSFDPKGSIQDRVTKYKTFINQDLKQFFPELAKVPNVEGLCLGLINTESSFVPTYINNWSVPSIINGFTYAKTSKKIYEMFGATQADLYNAFIDPLSTSRSQKYLVLEIITPHGLGQVMGYHFCQDLNLSSGKNIKTTFIKAFASIPRADGGSFACSVSSPAGTINNMFAGASGEANQVRASLIVLNDKYTGFMKSGRGATEAMKLALGSYLGGAGGDMNKTTPEVYLARIEARSVPPYGGGGKGSITVASNSAQTNGKNAEIKKACTLA